MKVSNPTTQARCLLLWAAASLVWVVGCEKPITEESCTCNITGWATFISPGGDFSVMLPGVPIEQMTTNVQFGFAFVTRAYRTNPDRRNAYSIEVMDYPSNIAADETTLLNTLAPSLDKVPWQEVKTVEDISLQGFNGKEILLEAESRVTLNYRGYLVGTRLYQLVSGQDKEHPCPYHRDLFFTSFKLLNPDQSLDPQDEEGSRLTELRSRYARENAASVLEDLMTFLKEYPDSFQGWLFLGDIHLKRGDFEKSIRDYEKVLELNPAVYAALLRKGVSLRKLERFDNCEAIYLQGIETFPEQSAEFYNGLVLLKIVQQEGAKAVEYGLQGMKKHPNDSALAARLSIAYHLLGDKQKRDEYFKIAKELGYPELDRIRKHFRDNPI